MACEASRSREPHTSLRSSATEPSGSRDLMCQRGSNRRSGKLRAEKTQSAFAEGGELPVPGSAAPRISTPPHSNDYRIEASF